ncbi:MAG: pyruvate dehydrogenase [Bdellovibrionaceae bacterium]|nr:pyruvate dehydrogenase [Pseudobdellovibrionaceae bacterium]
MSSLKDISPKALDHIFRRAHYLANQMVFQANHRKNKAKGDPKVGGHSSASSSALHILGTLHLFAKTSFDHISNKPHASPADHSFNYLLDLFLRDDFSKFTQEECDTAMMGLRAFSQNGEPVFQSYHSAWDPDRHNFFPSGTVGIPAVQAGYLALAYRYAKKHGYNVPDAHFWCVIGDSEFREGSLFEAVPDFAERELGNLTWIIDYNRQSLDGHRITNTDALNGTDAHRIERTMAANGWEVITVQHGRFRQKLFSAQGGEAFKNWFETELTDYDLQTLLLIKDANTLKSELAKIKSIAQFVESQKAEDLLMALNDMGGHDVECLLQAFEASKKSTDRPTAIVAHTIKGWGLEMAASSGNHSALPEPEEMEALRQAQGITGDKLFERFDAKSEEGKFLKARSEKLYNDILKQEEIRKTNKDAFAKKVNELPTSLDINLKFASYPHTQWMLGQLTSKLTRIANTSLDTKDKPLTDEEKLWKPLAENIVSMAPDVGTSTNLNPSMDGKIFSANEVDDIEEQRGVKDHKNPDLIPGEEITDRFLRFEIAEANVMSCAGSFGRMRDILGIPLFPLMTVYDFFIKRALDQYFYNMYWKSSFFLGGTPSGVTLSPEGAQHGWKSDIQVPNQTTWEPMFCQELDWIFCESLKRHFTYDNDERQGVVFRGVTRGIEQKDFLKYLKTQKRFKTDSNAVLAHKDYPMSGAVAENTMSTIAEADILETVRKDVLNGGYYLINYESYAGYNPGDNVVNIFSLGSLGTEAIKASNALLAKGIYANVIVVTNTDLLIGNPAYKNNYQHLKQNLKVNADLFLQPLSNGAALPGEAQTFSGRRIPIVSVHDGEAGLLDNIGSIVGVRQEALAVRKHSKCGRPTDIYAYHGIDADSVIQACGKVLSETALEQVKINFSNMPAQVRPQVEQSFYPKVTPDVDWSHLWDQTNA